MSARKSQREWPSFLLGAVVGLAALVCGSTEWTQAATTDDESPSIRRALLIGINEYKNATLPGE